MNNITNTNNMKKIIEIEECSECRHYYYANTECLYPEKVKKANWGMQIDSFPSIPDWCPLEDTEPKSVSTEPNSVSTEPNPVTDCNVMTAKEWIDLNAFMPVTRLTIDDVIAAMKHYAAYVAEIKQKEAFEAGFEVGRYGINYSWQTYEQWKETQK